MTENALIRNADMVFDDSGGRNGRNFRLTKGTYIQIPKTRIGEQVTGIKSIMAKDSEEWFETENHIYFGSEFFKGYDEV